MNIMPKSQLTGDKHTFYFPIVCQNCDSWFPSIGDCRKHFEQCISLQCHLLCGHCGQQWTDWPALVQHLNVKGMSHKQPCSAQYSWQHTGRLQNFLPPISCASRIYTADVLQSAMHAVGLPTVCSRPDDLSNAICRMDTVPDTSLNDLLTPKATSSPTAVRFAASQPFDDSSVDSDVTVHNTSHFISQFDMTTDEQTPTQILPKNTELSAATQLLAEEASQTSPVTLDSHNITLPLSLCTFMNNALLHKTARVHALLRRNNFIANILLLIIAMPTDY